MAAPKSLLGVDLSQVKGRRGGDMEIQGVHAEGPGRLLIYVRSFSMMGSVTAENPFHLSGDQELPPLELVEGTFKVD